MRGFPSKRSVARGLWAVLTALAVAGLMMTTSASAAADRAELRRAKRAFKTGQSMLKARRYADAVLEFRKAHAITGDGLVMGQIAIAYEKAGDYEHALRAIERYREALPEQDRAAVDPMAQKYEKLIAEGKSTPLEVPGEDPLAPPEPPAPEPSPSESAAPTEQPVEATPAAADQQDLLDEGPRRRRVWTWVAAGTAAALGVGALVLGLSAQSKFNELEDRCGTGTGGTCSSGDVDGVKTRALVTDVLWGTALAAGVTAGVLFFLEGRTRGAESGAKDSPSEDPGGNGGSDLDDDLVRRIDVAPLVGAGLYGVGATLRY